MVMGTGLGTTALNTTLIYMPLHALLHRYILYATYGAPNTEELT